MGLDRDAISSVNRGLSRGKWSEIGERNVGIDRIGRTEISDRFQRRPASLARTYSKYVFWLYNIYNTPRLVLLFSTREVTLAVEKLQ